MLVVVLLALVNSFRVELLAAVGIGLVNPYIVLLVFGLLVIKRGDLLVVKLLASSFKYMLVSLLAKLFILNLVIRLLAMVVGLLVMAGAVDLVGVSSRSDFTKRTLL